jgi:adenine deaminase
MKVMMRYGSAWQDVATQVKAITEQGLSPRSFMLCTDDSQAETIHREGHMDRVIRHAVNEGIDPMTAIQMATINTAEYFGVSREIGLIAPGRYADIVLVNDLAFFDIDSVYSRGKEISKSGKWLVDLPHIEYPAWARQSVHLRQPMEESDFSITVGKEKQVIVNVIGIIENQAPTQHLRISMKTPDGEVRQYMAEDLAKIAMIERHHSTGRVQTAMVHGFGFNIPCAVGTTVAHDCHQMIVVGTTDEDMVFAANELARIGGGQVVVSRGKVLGKIELPVAGLLSNESAENVANQAKTVLNGFKQCGCKLNNPNMQLSLLGLPVIPELRITDLGLVDVNRFDIIPVTETVKSN